MVCLLDVGSPALFWQQRLGRDSSAFLVYKFRTFKAPFDRQGHPIADRKPSFVGRLLRQTRVDELPQLLNVLVGDMALIGPDQLLAEDQPANPATRLTARPGDHGWAQVNGGKFLTPEEKDQYDELYIRKATFSFDLRILFMTLKVLLRMNGRSDHQVAAADRVGFGRHPAAFGDSISPPVRPTHAASTIESPALSVSGMSAAFPDSRIVRSNPRISSVDVRGRECKAAQRLERPHKQTSLRSQVLPAAFSLSTATLLLTSPPPVNFFRKWRATCASAGCKVEVVTSRHLYDDPKARLLYNEIVDGVEDQPSSPRHNSAGRVCSAKVSITHVFMLWPIAFC